MAIDVGVFRLPEGLEICDCGGSPTCMKAHLPKAPERRIDNFAVVKKHSHYKKDVSRLEFVDVYRVLQMFEVTHPAVQHAAKKVLCAGGRGAKDWAKDIQEAIDSLQRALDMHKEDMK